MEFYKTKGMINSRIDELVKNAIKNKRTMTINDYLKELGGLGAGEKMIRDRLDTHVLDGNLLIEKSSVNRKLDKVMPNMEGV